MSTEIRPFASFDDVTYVKLAREIAMDILPIEKILENHSITPETFERIKRNSYFQELLRSEIEAWQSATNTSERVRLKSLAFVEESLTEFYARAHDRSESLSAKTEVLKTVAKFAGIGVGSVDSNIVGEKFTVTINMGADQTLRIEKDANPKVIDHEQRDE